MKKVEFQLRNFLSTIKGRILGGANSIVEVMGPNSAYLSDAKLIRKSKLFDEYFYYRNYEDVSLQNVDPVIHYLRHGASEGRNPNSYFNTSWYLSENPDVVASGTNALIHYIRHGSSEGRKPSANLDLERYAQEMSERDRISYLPLAHYLLFGERETITLDEEGAVFTLISKHDVSSGQRKGLYRSTGDDPQFDLEVPSGRLPSGLNMFSFKTLYASQALRPKLYAWTPYINIPVEFVLPEMGSQELLSVFLVLPSDVSRLRFDPTDSADIEFGFEEISFKSRLPADAQMLLPSVVLSDDSRFQKLEFSGSVQLTELSPGLYKSTGHDPQLAIVNGHENSPSGWTRIRLATSSQAVLSPMIYAWQDGTVTQYRLPLMSGCAVREFVLRLPTTVTALRFDPTEAPDVEFRLDELSWAKLEADATVYRLAESDSRKLQYEEWVKLYDTISELDREQILRHIDQFENMPLISVLMPVYNTAPMYLRKALESVVNQLYPNWELCISDDCSPSEEVKLILNEYQERDKRIKVVFRQENGHISASSNTALEIVSGEFVALMDHDDELPPHALYMVAHEINLHPEADIIYTDEDKIDSKGRRHDPHFKTDWNLDLFYSQNFVAHLGVYRTSLARKIDGFRVGFEGSQDYDFVLRALAHTTRERIRHIPHVLYHWRIFEGVSTFSSDNPNKSIDTARQAMIDHFSQMGEPVTVSEIESFPSWWRIRRPLPAENPHVTLIIPTRDRVQLVRNCVDGILNKTDYHNLDVIIVDNGSIERETIDYFAELSRHPKVQVIRVDEPFNYSRLNNIAVAEAIGEYVAFINNDIEVIHPEWLAEMVSQVVRPGIGAVGAKLRYGNDNIQHAGVTLGVHGIAAHGHRHFSHDSIGYFGRPQLNHEVSAVTAAALLMPKSLFVQIGGFDEENLVVSYNDVDLCLRVREAGYQVTYTPFAELYHLESISRGPDVTDEQKERQRVERGFMKHRWGGLLASDPYYSPNLSLESEDFHLAFPPRATKPWRIASRPLNAISFEQQRKFDDIVQSGEETIAGLAAKTTVVIAAENSFGVLDSFLSNIKGADVLPGHIRIVNFASLSDLHIRRAAETTMKRVYPEINFDVMEFPFQDFNPAKAANFGLRDLGSDYFVLISENIEFCQNWFGSLLSSFMSLSSGDVLGCSAISGDRTVHYQSSTRKNYRDIIRATGVHEGYGEIPGPTYGSADDILASEPVVRADFFDCAVIFASAKQFLKDGDVFDPAFETLSFLEDFVRNETAKGMRLFLTSAALVEVEPAEKRTLVNYWKFLNDFVRINRPKNRKPGSDYIEFVCPFHRGDLLIGLQVAFTAKALGLNVRMHVAQGLVSWANDFRPPFPILPVPVSVPPAELTQLNLLLSYAHVIKQEDFGGRLARSHPERGLDLTGRNLAGAMLQSLGLPEATPIRHLVPQPTEEQVREANELIAGYGENTILLHASGGWGLKSIPSPMLLRLIKVVHEEGFKVLQIGGPGDSQIEGCDGWLLQGLSAGHWATIFRQTSGLFGVDSWSSHMAAILDTPQITFFGSTHPKHVRTKPYFVGQVAESIAVGPSVNCSPCNSLSCLKFPLNYCSGFTLNETEVRRFLSNHKKKAPRPRKTLKRTQN